MCESGQLVGREDLGSMANIEKTPEKSNIPNHGEIRDSTEHYFAWILASIPTGVEDLQLFVPFPLVCGHRAPQLSLDERVGIVVLMNPSYEHTGSVGRIHDGTDDGAANVARRDCGSRDHRLDAEPGRSHDGDLAVSVE